MAEQFLGLEVLVTLKAPSHTQLQGLVAGVAGQQLLLRDAFFPHTGAREAECRVDGAFIADLEVASRRDPPRTDTPTPTISSASHVAAVSTTTTPVPRPARGLDDPAILSMGRKPTAPPTDVHHSVSSAAHVVPHELLAHATTPPPSHAEISPPSQSSFAGGIHHLLSSLPAQLTNASREIAKATLTAPFSSLELSANGDDGGEPASRPSHHDAAHAMAPEAADWPVAAEADGVMAPPGHGGKRGRRGGTARKRKEAATKTPPLPADDEAEALPLRSKSNGRDQVFRHSVTSVEPETPERKPPVFRTKPRRTMGPAGGRRKGRDYPANGEHNDGWATEEATDIQGMGEFDFQGNLSKFDKRSVFNQIKAEDQTASEARLVHHNRMQPKPGTAGGKNLHYTENVLDEPAASNHWNSEAGDSDADLEMDGPIESGRNSRKARSRTSTKHSIRRGGGKSGAAAGPVPAMATVTATGPLSGSLVRGAGSSSHTVSPRPEATARTGSAGVGAVPSTKPSLRISPSNRLCPVVNPLQMLDVERIAEVEVGLTEDMMTENAGRGIAEVALSALDQRRQKLPHGAQGPLPAVVVLAGNNKSGARAVAGGRHLRNHGVRVTICVLGLEREDELLEMLRRQLRVFRNSGGRLSRWDEVAGGPKQPEAPPGLVIDALLGMHISFEDLRTDDQASAYELIRWANQSKACVLAIDAPSGVDASTGEVSLIEGETLILRADLVVAMGAPKTGLLNAIVAGQGQSWQLWAVDLGISNTAWRKYGTRRRHGVDFAQEWVVTLQYRAAGD
ncbi:MAG: enhancer of mRNA decapping [Thelocarpon superellum]|nr:MAG: enhancer of mRNA decapping [Thelocarpon superellum]